jgi:hypothetical protein
VPGSSFFNPLRFAQGFAKNVAQRYGEADKNLGGWLPGGGTASPLTRYKQEGERKLTQQYQESIDRQSAANDYVGKPGRFADQGMLFNAGRAALQAGVNPLAVAVGSKPDVSKLAKYYSDFPDVANEYTAPVNMFLRYLSGSGAEGMKISSREGKLLYDVSQKGIDAFKNASPEQLANVKEGYRQEYGQGVEKRFDEGQIPWGTSNPQLYENRKDRNTLNLSVGRYWAKQDGENVNSPDEKYDFPYANKQSILDKVSSFLKIPTPSAVSDTLVRQGYGKPFDYSAVIKPTGEVDFTPR